MKLLTANLHALGDYAAAAVLIVAPFILGLQDESAPAMWVSIAGGAGLLGYSLLTDYAFSVANVIPFRMHLLIDSLAGVVFIALPFLLGLDGIARSYLVIMGAGVLSVVAVTQSSGEKEQVNSDSPKDSVCGR